jgi:hypothetical protein
MLWLRGLRGAAIGAPSRSVSRERLERHHPQLALHGYTIESPVSRRYNCFAWAAGEDTSWWQPPDPDLEPMPGNYWPAGAPDGYTLDAFIQAYVFLGFAPCESGEFNADFDKIALYADEAAGEPTHAARQLPSGGWASKVGDWEDIVHRTVEALEGGAFGRVTVYLRRPRR